MKIVNKLQYNLLKLKKNVQYKTLKLWKFQMKNMQKIILNE